MLRSVAGTAGVVRETNKVLRQTYTLLAMTLLFSAATAGVAMAIGAPVGIGMVTSIVAMLLLWFVLPRVANSAAGIGVVFLTTGLLGFGIGPVISHYLNMANGSQVVMMAMGGTAVVFLALSAYAVTTKKDFSFMGGFLFVGVIVAMLAGIGAMLFSLPGLALGVSAMFVLLASGLILWETSNIVNGGETNYIMATVSLYVSIYNLFSSLLHLLGASNNSE